MQTLLDVSQPSQPIAGFKLSLLKLSQPSPACVGWDQHLQKFYKTSPAFVAHKKCLQNLYQPSQAIPDCKQQEHPTIYHRRSTNLPSWSQGVYSPRCTESILAYSTGWCLFFPHHFQHSIWMIQVEENALWNQFCPWVFQRRMHKVIEGLRGVELSCT